MWPARTPTSVIRTVVNSMERSIPVVNVELSEDDVAATVRFQQQ